MSLNEVGGDLGGIQRFLRDLGGFWKIELLFWRSFGLPKISEMLRDVHWISGDFKGFPAFLNSLKDFI